MEQLIILFFILVLLLGYFYSVFFKARKQSEYKNDERWLSIQLQASKIGFLYFQFLIIMISILITLILFFPSMNISLSLERFLFISFTLIIIGQLVEMVALKYFDKRM